MTKMIAGFISDAQPVDSQEPIFRVVRIVPGSLEAGDDDSCHHHYFAFCLTFATLTICSRDWLGLTQNMVTSTAAAL